jgi:cell division protein FtsZ
MTQINNFLAVLKVVGVGGGGVNSVNRMIEAGLRGVEFIAVNTDAQQLLMSDADVKLDIGRDSTRGLGAGADPAVGRKAAEDHADEIEQVLRGADMVFIAAGEGGGTGTGAAPVVARIAKSLGALTVAVVTRPFEAEGRRRMLQADEGIANLRKEVDALITVSNQRLIDLGRDDLTLPEAFKLADDILRAGVQGLTDLITFPATINTDFADVRSILQGSGTALMGIGSAKGEDRALRAAEEAINHPLLENSIDNAQGVLMQIAGASDMKLKEVNEATKLIQEMVHPDANIIWGSSIDSSLGDEIRVTVVAAGFGEYDSHALANSRSGWQSSKSNTGAIPTQASTQAPIQSQAAATETNPWYDQANSQTTTSAVNTVSTTDTEVTESSSFVSFLDEKDIEVDLEALKPKRSASQEYGDGFDIPGFFLDN